MGKNRGLGRGLAALVAEFPAGQVSMMELELSQVRPNPRQPRKSFEREAIDALAESIKHDGVVQPIIVRDGGEGYEIVAGERRWRAAKLAGLRTIPALVRPVDDRDSLILALAENVAREDLNAVEQARAYAVLSDELDLSQTEIARRVGKSRPAVANTMRLLELPDAALGLIEDGTLSEGHGRAVLQVQGQDERLALARQAAKRGLSVRETEEAARRLASGSKRRAQGDRRDRRVDRRGARQPGGRRRVAVDAPEGGGQERQERWRGRDQVRDAGGAREDHRPAPRRARFLG